MKFQYLVTLTSRVSSQVRALPEDHCCPGAVCTYNPWGHSSLLTDPWPVRYISAEFTFSAGAVLNSIALVGMVLSGYCTPPHLLNLMMIMEWPLKTT